MKKVIVIVGPTAVGKSSLSLYLAKKLNSPIISGDSVQIYKKLNIGSGKVGQDVLKEIKHYLIDIKDYEEDYSVSDFQKEVRSLLDKIDIPLIVGGTGLYIKAALSNYDFSNKKRSIDFEKQYENLSNEELYQVLLQLDPLQANIIHPNNRKRVLRAIECANDDHKISSNQDKDNYLYDAYVIFLDMERKQLYEKIDKRVDMMFEEGLLDEVKSLYTKYGYLKRAIGYQEFEDYFKGLISLDEVKAKIKLNSHHLAKRQYTWFKHQMQAHFYNVLEPNYQEKIYQDVLTFLKSGD